MSGAKKIVMLCVSPAQGVDVIGPLEVFSMASRIVEQSSGSKVYELELVTNSEDLRLATSSGVAILAHRHYREVRGKIDTLLIAGGQGARQSIDTALLDWIRKVASRARRICSICTGAALLADAGLLKGKRATTHWLHVESFARKHPDVAWDPNPIWVQDEHIYTSAGITAGMDLALGLLEEDFGSALALDVARRMVIFLRRPGSQAQFSVALAAQAAERKSLQELQVWIAEHLAADLSVEALAERVSMSARNFARVFTRELGVTPGSYVEQVRVEAARTQLESTEDGVEQIAARCGFSSAELLRRCFVRHFKVAPSEYRKCFRTGRALTTTGSPFPPPAPPV
jgi:transcriptional regulator GlxA family with amidase domain